MEIIPIIIISITYLLILFAIVSRIRVAVYKHKLKPPSIAIMWISEFLFTTLLPITGFVMLQSSGFGDLNEVNMNALFVIPENLFKYFSILSITCCLLYFVLRLLSEKSQNLNYISLLLLLPLAICIITCTWLGPSLGYGFIPIVITLPVLSPLLSTFYITMLLYQNMVPGKPIEIASDVIDEAFIQN